MEKKPTPYRARHPEKTAFYAVLYHHFDKFKAAYEDRFQERFGKWRSVIDKVVGNFLNCGIYLGGFARIRCATCGDEKLLALSC